MTCLKTKNQNIQTACSPSLPSQPLTYMRMVRRQHTPRNSSTRSFIASASACLPSAPYVEARLPMAVPARQVQTQPHPLSIITPHANHPSPRSPRPCQDGPQPARDAFIGCFLSDEMRLRRLCVAVEIGTGFRFGFRRLLSLESTWDEMYSF